MKGTIIQNYHKIIPGEGVLCQECFAHAAFGTAVAVSRCNDATRAHRLLDDDDD